MFLKREKSIKNIKQISKSILGFSVLLLILTLLLKLVFDGQSYIYFSIFFLFTFILGLCIGAIPDILEKDVNILADILLLLFSDDCCVVYFMILAQKYRLI